MATIKKLTTTFRAEAITAGWRRRIFWRRARLLTEWWEETHAFGDELAGAVVHHWNDWVFENVRVADWWGWSPPSTYWRLVFVVHAEAWWGGAS